MASKVPDNRLRPQPPRPPIRDMPKVPSRPAKKGADGINRRKEEDLNRKTPLNADEKREAGKRGYKLANEIGGIGGYLVKGLVNGKGATKTATEDVTKEMKTAKRKELLIKAMKSQYSNGAEKFAARQKM